MRISDSALLTSNFANIFADKFFFADYRLIKYSKVSLDITSRILEIKSQN